MRHGKKFNHLGRQAPHRKSMLSNMSASLILHKRISTTLAKAKELKKHVEPLVTRAKEDTTHNRRVAFSFLQSKEAIKILFGDVAEKVGSRPGGYTRIIKTGYRLGDNAEMCIIELVDFNELMLKEDKPAKKTTRRSRRGSGKAAEASADQTAEKTAENKETAPPKAEPKGASIEEPNEAATDDVAEADDAKAQTEEKPATEGASETEPKAEEGKTDETDASEDDKKTE